MAIKKNNNFTDMENTMESKDKKSRRRWGDITLYKETLTLPEGVTHVRDIVLFDSSSLTLPEGVKKVGDIELYDRSSLTLSKGLTQVGGLYALSGGCSITFPDGYMLKNSGRRRLQYSAKEINRLFSEHQNVHEDVSFILSTKEHDPSLDPTGTVYTVFPEDIENGIVPPGCDIGVDSKGNRFLKTFNESRTVPEDGLVLVKKYDASNVYTVCTKKQFDVLYKVGEDGLAKKVSARQELQPGPKQRKGKRL